MPVRSLLRIDAVYGDQALDVVRALRYQVLREPLGLPFESTLFAGDTLASTLHVIGYTEQGPAGCLTLLMPDSPTSGTAPFAPHTPAMLAGHSCDRVSQPGAGTETPADCVQSVQLRGMAVVREHQGHGVGGQLLTYVYSWAQTGPCSLWCNARESAVPFYAKYHWTVHGDAFEIPPIGRHFIMRWEPFV